MPRKFDLLLFDAFSNHCLANIVEPLRAANMAAREPLYEWRFLTLDGATVASSSGMEVRPHGSLTQGRGDVLAVMPSYGYQTLDRQTTTRALQHAKPRYKTLAGFDTGSWLLARAGFLDGYRATIHWEVLSRFEETFPNVDAVRQRYVIDRDRVTCSGAMAAFDLVMHFIGQLPDPLIAVEVAQLFMTDHSARAYTLAPSPGGRLVDRTLRLMQENLETPFPIAELARRMKVTQKQLELRMRAELKETPQAVYCRLRLNLARQLVVESDQSVAEIAGRCGYENASAMARAFKTQFGASPRQMRQSGSV